MERQTFSRLLSALPYFQQLLSHTLPILELNEEESLGLMDVTAHTLRLLCLLLHFQKRFGISPQLLGSQLQAALEYDASVSYTHLRAHETTKRHSYPCLESKRRPRQPRFWIR